VAAEAGGAPNSGTHSVLFKKTLSNKGISVQRYWNGAIVGPDCRKFLKMFRAVLEIIRAEIEKKTWRCEGQKWFDRHVAVLKELDVVGNYCLLPRTSMLLLEELDALQAACTAYGAAYREAYPNHPILTHKGHLIEMHLASIARRFGTVGIFGEDGMEAMHPLDSRARLLVQSMRKAVDRHKALTAHTAIPQNFVSKKEQTKYARVRKNQMASAGDLDLTRDD